MVQVALAGGWGRKFHLYHIWPKLYAEPFVLPEVDRRFFRRLSPEENTKYSFSPEIFVSYQHEHDDANVSAEI